MVSSSHLLQGVSPLSPRAVWLTLPGASQRAHSSEGGERVLPRLPEPFSPACHSSSHPHVEAAQSPTGLWTQRSRHFLEAWGSIAQGLLRDSLYQGAPHLETHTWGACTCQPAPGGLRLGPVPGGLQLGACAWGPAPRGPVQGAKHWGQGQSSLPKLTPDASKVPKLSKHLSLLQE